MVRGRRGKKPDRHPGEESLCTGLQGSSVPAGHAPARSSLRTKTGKAAAFPVRPEREVRGSALKGVAGGRKGLVRQFGLLLEQLPDAPVRDAVPAGQKAHLGIAGGTGGGMAAEGAEQLPLAHLTGETGAAGGYTDRCRRKLPAGGARRARAAGRAAGALPTGSGGGMRRVRPPQCSRSLCRAASSSRTWRSRRTLSGKMGSRLSQSTGAEDPAVCRGSVAGLPLLDHMAGLRGQGTAGALEMCLQRLLRVVRPLPGHEGPGSRDGFRGRRHGIAGLAGRGLHVFQHAGDAAHCAAAQSREPSAGSSSLSADCVRRRWNCSRDRVFMSATPFLIMGRCPAADLCGKVMLRKKFSFARKSGPGLLYPLPLATGCSMFDSSHSRTFLHVFFFQSKEKFLTFLLKRFNSLFLMNKKIWSAHGR